MSRAITAVKPTNTPTLGNWLGAIKPFIQRQYEYDESFLFIADLHALTLPIEPEKLRQNIFNLCSIYLAAGLDVNHTTLFKQSDVSAHNQLEWVLTCNTVLGEFTKMPQYKKYLEEHKNQATPSGMLMYPSLMNADILLYDIDIVPVGIDQMSHIDLCRDVADKFNRKYGETFVLPKGILQTKGAKIMSLSDPTRKMSKSESDKGTIYLLDDIEISKKKIMKALTDSEDKVYYDPEKKPGISNLMTIYSCLTNMSFDEIENRYKDAPNYGVFKKDLAEIVGKELETIQKRVNEYKDNKETLSKILADGAERANKIADKKINKVFQKIGIR